MSHSLRARVQAWHNQLRPDGQGTALTREPSLGGSHGREGTGENHVHLLGAPLWPCRAPSLFLVCETQGWALRPPPPGGLMVENETLLKCTRNHLDLVSAATALLTACWPSEKYRHGALEWGTAHLGPHPWPRGLGPFRAPYTRGSADLVALLETSSELRFKSTWLTAGPGCVYVFLISE